MPPDRVGGAEDRTEHVKRAQTVTYQPSPSHGPGQTYGAGVVRAKFKAYEPHLSVGGMAQEGQALAVNVSFPLLPPGHPEVSLRVLVTWLREDLGKYWLTDGDAIARSQLRQRGLYEPANFIPSVDLKPPDQRKYSVIEGETSLEYVCRKEDIGRRVGLTVQPISSLGQLGNVYTAWSSEVLISYPHTRTLSLFDVNSQTPLSLRVAQGPAAEMMPEAGSHLVFPVVGHRVRADFDYIGGEPGEHSIKWWRVGATKDKLIAFQTREYKVEKADTECQIRVEVVPVRIDGTQGCAREVYTGRISDKCFYSSAPHVHTQGFCPFELSSADLLVADIPEPLYDPPRTAGVGLVVRADKNGSQVVRQLLPFLPAANSGKIQPGDTLLEVDGEPVLGKNVVDIIPGPEGSTVRLKLERERTEANRKDPHRIFEVQLVRSSPTDTITKPRSAPADGAVDGRGHSPGNVTLESVLGGGINSIFDPLGLISPGQRQ